jgi:hypothetical protein
MEAAYNFLSMELLNCQLQIPASRQEEVPWLLIMQQPCLTMSLFNSAGQAS